MKARIAVAGIESCPILSISATEKIVGSDSRFLAAKLIAAAEGEKRANELRMQTLTPLLIQQQMIEKWDGKLPIYGVVPTLFKDITK